MCYDLADTISQSFLPLLDFFLYYMFLDKYFADLLWWLCWKILSWVFLWVLLLEDFHNISPYKPFYLFCFKLIINLKNWWSYYANDRLLCTKFHTISITGTFIPLLWDPQFSSVNSSNPSFQNQQISFVNQFSHFIVFDPLLLPGSVMFSLYIWYIYYFCKEHLYERYKIYVEVKL